MQHVAEHIWVRQKDALFEMLRAASRLPVSFTTHREMLVPLVYPMAGLATLDVLYGKVILKTRPVLIVAGEGGLDGGQR